MKTKHLKWLLPLLLLPILRQEVAAQTESETRVDTIVVSDTLRWTWKAQAAEDKFFSFVVGTPGRYRIWWGDGDMKEYCVPLDRIVSGSHQYVLDGEYEVMVMGVGGCLPELGVDIELVYVEGGEFEMGATAEQGEDAYDWEKPVHTVRLDSYYIGKYEVTQAQWKAVMGETMSQYMSRIYPDGGWHPWSGGDDLPMYYVTLEEAWNFCRKLSEATGRKYVLPTEAQWEYAARGGNRSQHYKYAGSNEILEVAWCEGSVYPGGHPQPVGRKKANELGIYDMSGNVLEWCSDWYGWYDENDIVNPQGPENGTIQVRRGGSESNNPRDCRVSTRFGNNNLILSILGFRVVMLL